jgi:hypothetical protein
MAQVLLAATAIALDLFSIALAVLAYLGYRSIQRSALAAAEKAVVDKLKEYFEGQALPVKITEAIQERIQAEVDLISSNFIAYVQHENTGEVQEQPIASDYPEAAGPPEAPNDNAGERTDSSEDRQPPETPTS